MRFIVDCEPEHAPAALAHVLAQLKSYEQPWLKIGHGWGATLHSCPGVSFFARRTKSGVSIKGYPIAPIQEGDGR